MEPWDDICLREDSILNSHTSYNHYGYFDFMIKTNEINRLRAICNAFDIELNLGFLDNGLEYHF